MKTDCTELFFRYREIARLVWNLGFWVEPKLRQWDALQLYRELSARLFRLATRAKSNVRIRRVVLRTSR
jgi:hypothetical protein